MSNLSFVILIVLVSIGIGFALGSLITGARGERTPAEKPKPQTVPSLVQVAGIMTDRGGKVVYLLIEEKVVRSAAELSREQRTRLAPYFDVLNSWFNPIPPAAMAGALSAEIAPPAGIASTPTETKRPNTGPLNLLSRAARSDPPPEPPKSIVVQINDILQEKLENTPLETRGIRLKELPNQAMAVVVGLDQYDGIEDVPDEEIRSIIRSAVSDWEKRVST